MNEDQTACANQLRGELKFGPYMFLAVKRVEERCIVALAGRYSVGHSFQRACRAAFNALAHRLRQSRPEVCTFGIQPWIKGDDARIGAMSDGGGQACRRDATRGARLQNRRATIRAHQVVQQREERKSIRISNLGAERISGTIK